MSADILDAMNGAFKAFSHAHQLLLNLNSLLGKPQKDPHKVECRTICKTPMLYRLAALCESDVDTWADNFIHMNLDYDTSGKGKSALRASICRGALAEIEVVLGRNAAGAFIDFPNFSTR